MNWQVFITPNTDFGLFNKQHLLMLGLVVLLSVIFSVWGRYWATPAVRLHFARGYSLILAGTVVLWTAIRFLLGEFDHQTDLPFDICNMLALLAPFYAWNPNQKIHDIVYLWILAGTLQAVLTPHLLEGFPHFTFLKYWIVHGGLVVFAIYLTVAFKLFPSRKAIPRAFIALQGYALMVLIFNLLLRANYVYLLGKPPTASVLDLFGPWPIYLLVLEGVVLLFFVVIYGITWLTLWRYQKSISD